MRHPSKGWFSEFLKQKKVNVILKQKITELEEVTVSSKRLKKKRKGVVIKMNTAQGLTACESPRKKKPKIFLEKLFTDNPLHIKQKLRIKRQVPKFSVINSDCESIRQTVKNDINVITDKRLRIFFVIYHDSINTIRNKTV